MLLHESEVEIQAHTLLPPDTWSSSATAQLAGTWLESRGGTDASAVGGVLGYKPSPQHLPLPPSHHLSEQRRGAKLTAAALCLLSGHTLAMEIGLFRTNVL